MNIIRHSLSALPAALARLGRSATMKNSVANFIALAFVTLASACVVPFPSFKHPSTGREFQDGDLSFVKEGVTSRSDILNRFGEPWAYYPDLRVSVYCWDRVKYYLFVGVPFVKADGFERSQLYVLFIKFDDQERVNKSEIMKHAKGIRTKDFAAEWSARTVSNDSP